MNIHRFSTFGALLVAFSATLSCKTKDSTQPPKINSLILKISFHPAFAEWSETVLKKSASEKSIKVLLKDQLPAHRKQDTFWFKEISLSDQQYSLLDSILIPSCQQKISKNSTLKGLDGMTIKTLLTIGNDTNFIYLWSPREIEDSIGYQFTESLLTALKETFQDTVAIEYFNELEEYIDDSKRHTADPERKIDQLRMEKYGWQIRKRFPNKKRSVNIQ